MALTKHQKLARGLQNIISRIDRFYEKVSQNPESIVQFYFYLPCEYKICPSCIRNPHMKKNALITMIQVCKYGIIHFSPNLELREICFSKEVIGWAFYLPKELLKIIQTNVLAVQWKLEIMLPIDSLNLLKKTKEEALLYCPSNNEMSYWIDWYDKENKTNTYTNMLLENLAQKKEEAILEKNLNSPSYSIFIDEVKGHFGIFKFNKAIKTLAKAKFIPNKNTPIASAYELVFQSLKNREQRHHDEFKHKWKQTLEQQIFKDLSWSHQKRKEFIARCFSTTKAKKKKNERWSTSQAIDRQIYSAFIQFFIKIFIKDPIAFKHFGEIILFLWIAIHIAQNPNHDFSVKKILNLTTQNIDHLTIKLDETEIEISEGLANLINVFIGKTPLKRAQKIFPNLTIDRLEDLFHKASKEILQQGEIPILPEAFLTFPHALYDNRISVKQRKTMQKNPPKIHMNNPSLREIKKQLFKTKQNTQV